jgi:hypothetical protein
LYVLKDLQKQFVKNAHKKEGELRITKIKRKRGCPRVREVAGL